MMEHGAIALVGSGEYTHAMNEVDRQLLGTIGRRARVVLLPTASGREPGMPARWNTRGVNHFDSLGAEVVPLAMVTREDAYRPANVEQIAAGDFFYFSGGDPNYVVECWQDTPAWAALVARWRQGAVLAGCSAGAMMLGPFTIRLRTFVPGSVPQWAPALGLVPNIAVMPHFDRIRNVMTDEQLRAVLRTMPAAVTAVGVDEDTALLRLDGCWQVAGRQGVAVFDADGVPTRFVDGDSVPLPPV